MKKVLKVLGIIVLIIIGLVIILLIKNVIESYKPYLKDDYYNEFTTKSPLEEKYAKLGSYEVSQVDYEADEIGKVRVWYPSELEKQNKKYPMIILVNASNTRARNYEPYFNHLASWGFIVVGNEDPQAGSALKSSKMLDYMLSIGKDSVLYNKIDKDNLGIIGHSQGGAGAIRAVTEFENGKNYKTIFTGSAAYPLLATSMGWSYDSSKISIPYFMTAGTGTSDDTGVEDIDKEYGGVAPLKSLVDTYNKMSNDVFKVRARFVGAEHGDMLAKTDPYMTAWMLYQLKNDEEAGKVFIGDEAEILTNKNWQDVEKNQ